MKKSFLDDAVPSDLTKVADKGLDAQARARGFKSHEEMVAWYKARQRPNEHGTTQGKPKPAAPKAQQAPESRNPFDAISKYLRSVL